MLTDALTLQGVIWARLGVHDSSVHILRRAADVGEDAGASPHAGRSLLTLLEEHGARRLTQEEGYRGYIRADRLLKGSQNAEDAARLRACARVVMRRLYGARLDKDFSLFGAVHELESRLIKEALEEAGGSVTRAARLLGIGHQTLIAMLDTRHRGLLDKRKPRRRRSIIKKSAGGGKKPGPASGHKAH